MPAKSSIESTKYRKILRIVVQALNRRSDWLHLLVGCCLVAKEMRVAVCGSQLGHFYDPFCGELLFHLRLEKEIARFTCLTIISLFDGGPLASKMTDEKSWSVIHLVVT
jgi:hypothetical protein